MIRAQDYTGAKNLIREVYLYLERNPQFLQTMSEIYGVSSITAVMGELNDAMSREDMVLLADMMEANVLPAISAYIREKLSTITDGRYNIECSLSGFLTIKDTQCNKYLHSNIDPVSESRIIVDKYFNPENYEYAVWGAGLGYHVERLYRKASGAMKILVYDDDPLIIDIAQKYGMYDMIPSHKISLIADLTGKEFSDRVNRGACGIFIHLPSLEKIQNNNLYDPMRRFFLKFNGFNQLKDLLAVNFRENMGNCTENVCKIKSFMVGKEVVIVGGGPSLDDNTGFLNDSKAKGRVILSVNTVLKRLIEMDIVPDYTVVMDAKEEAFIQMKGLEGENRPGMIVGSTSYWKFAAEYKGKKYIAFQEGYKDAEENARTYGYDTFSTGHSVTTLALSIALKFQASTIYLVGADMAYKNGMSHATGTNALHRETSDELIPVRGVDGNIVYTTRALSIFREWIEDEIVKYPNVSVVNMSKTGAYIKGTITVD